MTMIAKTDTMSFAAMIVFITGKGMMLFARVTNPITAAFIFALIFFKIEKIITARKIYHITSNINPIILSYQESITKVSLTHRI